MASRADALTASAPRRPFRNVGSQTGLLIFMLAMEASFALIEPRIVSVGNIMNVVQQASYLLVLTIAQTLVILTRGFDLSLGTTVSAVSVASALVMTGFGDVPTVPIVLLGVVAGLGLAACVGSFNGLLVAWIGINPFIATLASLNICLGIATTISGGRPVFGVPEMLSTWLNDVRPFGVRITIWIAVGVSLLAWVTLTRTVFGRIIVLLGANPRAAEVAGVPVRRALAVAYLACSLLGGVGALMLTARTGSGEPNLGGSLMLQSIAAAVIGGVSLRGGKGGVGAAVLGTLFVTMLSNGMNLLRISGYVQMISLGVMIILATAFDALRGDRAA